jgi:hypothetical protein
MGGNHPNYHCYEKKNSALVGPEPYKYIIIQEGDKND